MVDPSEVILILLDAQQWSLLAWNTEEPGIRTRQGYAGMVDPSAAL